MLRRLFLLAVLAAVPAAAHDAPSGWPYPGECCDGQDCAPIPYERVRSTPHGYELTLKPGDHPLITEAMTIFVPRDRAEPSGDRSYHLCYKYSYPFFWCFFVPMGDA